MQYRSINSIILQALAALSVAGFSACTKNFTNYNTNPYLATLQQQQADNYYVGQKFPAMMFAVLPAGDVPGQSDYVNSYQVAYNLAADCFSGYMGEANNWNSNNNNLTYDFTVGWNNAQFDLNATLMASWKDIKEATTLSGDTLQFYVAEVIKVIGIIRMTDSYGPVPYSAIPTGSFTPFYDGQDSIYYSALRDLVRARDLLYKFGPTAGKPLERYDLIYAGDYLKWAKLANSLILRLSMRIRYADPATARKFAEAAVSNPAGLLESLDENAVLGIKAGNGSINYSNPLVVLTETYNEARMGASMGSYLSGYQDPRIGVYFKPSDIPGHSTEYVGVRSGINAEHTAYTPFSQLNFSYSDPMPWMRASEVCFLRAEGAILGWNMGGTAAEFYDQGITKAFSESGVAMPAGYLTDDHSTPAAYTDYATPGNSASALSSITIKWNEAAGVEQKLERIITQKWIALYPNGPEAWAEFRRTGYPKIFPVIQNKSGGAINSATQVRRIPYPQAQYTSNAASVSKATELLGGPDNGGTRLWWDKK